MSEQRTIATIRPELLAHKLAAIRNHEYPELLAQIEANPRLVAVLCFLQFVSMQPGGLVKFCEDMIIELPHVFGTGSMRAARSDDYSFELKISVWREIPMRFLPPGAPNGREDDWLTRELLDDDLADRKLSKEDERALTAFLNPLNAEDFRACSFSAAREHLPDYFYSLCTEKDKNLADQLWFMGSWLDAVIEMMDKRAAEISKRLAMTAVTRKVFDALDYALQERAMVRIVGDSRFGKTESLRAFCDMRPGLARLVTVPCSNSLADLYKRIAEALGIETSYGSPAQRLKEKIEYVLRHTRLFLVFDEGAFLLPQNYTASTAPARLNWVRTEIVDRGLPLAIVVTPQSFQPAVDRFVKRTGYAMEQFFGRNYRTVQLPAELDEADMAAVARIHFPEMGQEYLELIADLARVSENYLQAVEAIAKLARFIARREGHKAIKVADIKAAASEVIPSRFTERGDAEIPAPVSEPRKRARNSDSHMLQTENARFDSINLPSRSLRSNGSDQVETEFVSVGS